MPTPLDRHREPDLGFVIGTTDAIVPYLRRGQIVSLESTTYPGTTEEELLPRIQSAGFRVGKDIFLATLKIIAGDNQPVLKPQTHGPRNMA